MRWPLTSTRESGTNDVLDGAKRHFGRRGSITAVPLFRLDNAADPRLDDYRNLPDREMLERRGIFIAEGRLVVKRLLEDRRFPVRSVLVSETAFASDDVFGRYADAAGANIPTFVVRQEILNLAAGFNIHRGCLAIGERLPPVAWSSLLGPATTIVVVERVANADNIGGIFRNAAAFGAGAVLLEATCTDPLYRKAIRTSMGTALRVPFARMEPWPEALRELKALGWTLVGLTPSGDVRLDESVPEPGAGSLQPKLALLVGHEGEGLTDGALALCDHRARIPMAPGADSLNVAAAAAVALYVLAGRRLQE